MEAYAFVGGDRGQANGQGAQFLKRAVQTGSEGGSVEPPGGLLKKGYYKKKAAHMCKGPGVVLNLACSGRSSETLSLGQRD